MSNSRLHQFLQHAILITPHAGEKNQMILCDYP